MSTLTPPSGEIWVLALTVLAIAALIAALWYLGYRRRRQRDGRS